MLGLALGACAASEPQPALVAKSATGSYGYSETRLSESRYEVVYETPSFDVAISQDNRQRELEREKQRAYDFALWRAAETAKAQGYTAIAVEQDRRDANVSLRSEPVYRPWPGFYPHYGFPYRYGYGPGYGYGYGPWGYDPWDYGYQRWASARVIVSLRVRFLKANGGASLSVDETLSRLASTYGSPTYD